MNKRGVANIKNKIIKEYIKDNINPNVCKSNFKIDTSYKLTNKTIYSYIDGKRNIINYIGRDYNIFNKSPFMLISLELFTLAGELSKSGYRLLGYIFKNLKIGSPKIKLSNIEVAKELNEKYTYVISNAKKELINKNIIEKYKDGNNDEYLINVSLLFKGKINEYLSDYGAIYGDDECGIIVDDN